MTNRFYFVLSLVICIPTVTLILTHWYRNDKHRRLATGQKPLFRKPKTMTDSNYQGPKWQPIERETIVVSLIKKYSKNPDKPLLYYVTYMNNNEPKPWMSVKTLKRDMDLFIYIWRSCGHQVTVNEK